MEIKLTNKKVFKLLPSVAIIGERLQDDLKKELGEKKLTNSFALLFILKNIEKIEKEVFQIVASLMEVTVKEVADMPTMKTIVIFKGFLDTEEFRELLNFTGVLPSTD